MTPELPPDRNPIVDGLHRYIDTDMLQIHDEQVGGYVVSIPYQAEEGQEQRVVSSITTYGDEPFHATRPRIEDANGDFIDERHGMEFIDPESAVQACREEVVEIFEHEQM